MGWQGNSSAVLGHNSSWNFIHLLGLLELKSLDGLTLMSGASEGIVGKLEPLSPHDLSWIFEPKLFPMVAEPQENTGRTSKDSWAVSCRTFTVSLLSHSKGQSKSPGQPRFKGVEKEPQVFTEEAATWLCKRNRHRKKWFLGGHFDNNVCFLGEIISINLQDFRSWIPEHRTRRSTMIHSPNLHILKIYYVLALGNKNM